MKQPVSYTPAPLNPLAQQEANAARWKRWTATPLHAVNDQVYYALEAADLPIEDIGATGESVIMLTPHGDEGPQYRITITEEW